MLAGLWLHLGRESGVVGLKIALAVFFQFLTIPVASHLLTLMAWKQNLPRWRQQSLMEHGRTDGQNTKSKTDPSPDMDRGHRDG
jgi:multicomponent Na+:H+ antiporter subunit G